MVSSTDGSRATPANDPFALEKVSKTGKQRSKKLQDVSNVGSQTIAPIPRRGKSLSKRVTQTVVEVPEVKRDVTRYYPTFLHLLQPIPEGVLGEVLPQIANDKKLAPYLSDILVELGCEKEKKIIEKCVQWLNTRPTQLGTLALVQQWPDEDAAGKIDLLKFIHYSGQDKSQMETKFKEILSSAGTSVYDKLYAAHTQLASA